MKTRLIISAILLSIVLIAGCKREGCTDPNATNYDSKAKKDNNTCVYPPPPPPPTPTPTPEPEPEPEPEPDPDPDPDPRDAFLGSYEVVDSLFMFGEFYSKTNYILLVGTGNTISDTVYLNNLWGDGRAYLAIIADNIFNIPSQQVDGPYYTSGNGNFNGNVITYETSGDVYLHKGSGTKK